ncbi:hypothetical protein C7974DRAFT_476068 [Boeremia exigua]|uniref:uncharacterized protein n=1 Tax=Boeremia exigua TaxID=749465 RepID=UPI001E8CFB1B|nr:uncharacterized protein C7974DRAFT_476068 [Boeremia exigua]KAH6614307.1 hypothetical protein C7974DRAFT_476068 [Boeremia exigua]
MNMDRLKMRRKIFIFATAAGSGFGGLHGFLHLPDSLKHWGIIVAAEEDDENALMVELDKKDRAKKNSRTPIHPLVRTREERAEKEPKNPVLKTVNIKLETRLSNEAIKKAALEVCEKMGGYYHVLHNNCQTFVLHLVRKIHLAGLTQKTLNVVRNMLPSSSRQISKRAQQLLELERKMARYYRCMVIRADHSLHGTMSGKHISLGKMVALFFKGLLQDLGES